MDQVRDPRLAGLDPNKHEGPSWVRKEAHSERLLVGSQKIISKVREESGT